jgi:glycosyltransferase involved in cell wall biosynthesis
MTPQAVVQVAGRLRSADPVAATARIWASRLTRLGWSCTGVVPEEVGEPTRDAELIVHSVDGGEALTPLLDRLGADDQLTLVHHGSAPGSDRNVLRELRVRARRALAADPDAREELRRLGFRNVTALDPTLSAGPLGVDPDEATATELAGHPGPRILCVGPLGPNRGIEVLLSAFADVVTCHHPGAVLTLCGPAPHWYRKRLHRTITRQGLLACEVVAPSDDSQVLARIVHAACMVDLRPAALDPYLYEAAARGTPVVAPAVAATSALADGSLVAVQAGHRAAVTAALVTAALVTALDREGGGARATATDERHLDVALARALGVA